MNKPSALYSAFATDRDVEKSGIFIQYGTVERDGKEVPVQIKIARAGGGNARFDKVFEVKTKPYKRMIQTDTLPDSLNKQIMREVYAECVILGWENVQDADGEFIEFNQKNVIQVMTDLPDLFTDIQVQANKAALFRKMIVEEDVKN